MLDVSRHASRAKRALGQGACACCQARGPEALPTGAGGWSSSYKTQAVKGR